MGKGWGAVGGCGGGGEAGRRWKETFMFVWLVVWLVVLFGCFAFLLRVGVGGGNRNKSSS